MNLRKERDYLGKQHVKPGNIGVNLRSVSLGYRTLDCYEDCDAVWFEF